MENCSEHSLVVTLRGGFVVAVAVVHRLIDLEMRGATFIREANGQFRVVPATVLTPDDIAFLHAHRDECRRVLDYDADAQQEDRQ